MGSWFSNLLGIDDGSVGSAFNRTVKASKESKEASKNLKKTMDATVDALEEASETDGGKKIIAILGSIFGGAKKPKP